ncbi:MAG: AAC(3) family N-acetyltransferase [Prevotellaceae bacterium]|jgi:aminoglycoside 3-N-acetyltransferase|nr:AAC(3) family N-acetyltransferase [Prevotellaceae bacterium]
MKFKKIISYIIYFLPEFIVKPLKKLYRKRQLKHNRDRSMQITVSKEDIASVLNRLDLDSDVFLHSSISNIGQIEFDIKSLCGLLLEKIDINKNTLLASALPFRGRTKDYLEKGIVFDVRKARIEMGIINVYLSRHHDAKRSLHPTHSVIAIGPKADYYTTEHHLDITPFGIHSPYYKLIETNAKILMFGVGPEYLTFVHVVEDIFGEHYPVNPYLKKVYIVEVIDNTGKVHFVQTRCHDSFKSIKRDIYNLLPYFIRYNAIERHKIGETEISVLNAKTVVYAYYMALLDGVSFYGKFHLKDNFKKEINEQLDLLNSI